MIDAHQHFWDISRADCSWPTHDLQVIYRNYGIEDYQQASGECGVAGSVLVQSQACDSDTDYLVALADKNEQILAVVGWVDMVSSSAQERIQSLAERSKLRGLRPMLQSIEDTAGFAR